MIDELKCSFATLRLNQLLIDTYSYVKKIHNSRRVLGSGSDSWNELRVLTSAIKKIVIEGC